MVTVVGKDINMYLKVSCRNCASELQYTRSEVQTQMQTDYGGGKELHKYITCPTCGNKVRVKD
jgi:predicted nucleic-acid-binding Zn-ribbon protein